MVFFGLGTLPLMFGLSLASKFFGSQMRFKLQKFMPILLGLVGVMLIVRGLGLDLGPWSPRVIAHQAFIAICG